LCHILSENFLSTQLIVLDSGIKLFCVLILKLLCLLTCVLKIILLLFLIINCGLKFLFEISHVIFGSANFMPLIKFLAIFSEYKTLFNVVTNL